MHVHVGVCVCLCMCAYHIFNSNIFIIMIRVFYIYELQNFQLQALEVSYRTMIWAQYLLPIYHYHSQYCLVKGLTHLHSSDCLQSQVEGNQDDSMSGTWTDIRSHQVTKSMMIQSPKVMEIPSTYWAGINGCNWYP